MVKEAGRKFSAFPDLWKRKKPAWQRVSPLLLLLILYLFAETEKLSDRDTRSSERERERGGEKGTVIRERGTVIRLGEEQKQI